MANLFDQQKALFLCNWKFARALKKPRVLDYHKNYIDGNLVLNFGAKFQR